MTSKITQLLGTSLAMVMLVGSVPLGFASLGNAPHYSSSEGYLATFNHESLDIQYFENSDSIDFAFEFFKDDKEKTPLKEVTVRLEIWKSGEILARNLFYSDDEKMTVEIRPDESCDIHEKKPYQCTQYFGNEHPVAVGALYTIEPHNPVIKGPIFTQGGLYEIVVTIVGDGIRNSLDEPSTHQFLLPVAQEYTFFTDNFPAPKIKLELLDNKNYSCFQFLDEITVRVESTPANILLNSTLYDPNSEKIKEIPKFTDKDGFADISFQIPEKEGDWQIVVKSGSVSESIGFFTIHDSGLCEEPMYVSENRTQNNSIQEEQKKIIKERMNIPKQNPCKNDSHVQVIRPNGKLACVFESTAEKLDWMKWEKFSKIENPKNLRVTSTLGNADYHNAPFEEFVVSSNIVVLATIESIDMVTEDFEPYRHIMLGVDQYVLDRTQQFADKLVVKTYGEGEGIKDGEAVYFRTPRYMDYEVGDQALFRLHIIPNHIIPNHQDLPRFDGYADMFTLDENGFFQTAHKKQMYEVLQSKKIIFETKSGEEYNELLSNVEKKLEKNAPVQFDVAFQRLSDYMDERPQYFEEYRPTGAN